jgi:ATP-dependent RNA helicase RhlB
LKLTTGILLETSSRHSQHNRPASKTEWSPENYIVPEAAGKTRFHDLNLHPALLHAIADLGFQYCSPIQAEALPKTLRGHDVIGKAQTGTGKTAAFLITILNDLLNNPVTEERFIGEPRALVIAPTRELVEQIASDAKALTTYVDMHIVTLIGGMDFQKQQQHLEKKLVDIVVATPGRLIDFLERKHVFLDQIELLVIDEADRMLDMGFIPQVKRLIRATPPKESRQTLLFSATFTQDILNLSAQWTLNPVWVEIEPDSVATKQVEQKVYIVGNDQKFKLLYNILEQENVTSAIVFANRRDQTQRLYDKLQKKGLRCGLLSGDVSQQKRSKTLKDFKEGKLQILVATDVAGRGIHIDGISHVINYTLPEDAEDYVHRIGRTGRAGASGVSISFACEDDAFLLPNIEQLLGEKLLCEQPPEELLG